MSELSPATWERLKLIFRPEDKEKAASILMNECGTNLPHLENSTPEGLERIRFAVVKMSDGNIRDLQYMVYVAKRDWRDVLGKAGFADSFTTHLEWVPKNKDLDGKWLFIYKIYCLLFIGRHPLLHILFLFSIKIKPFRFPTMIPPS
jgi:hypothetical protein